MEEYWVMSLGGSGEDARSCFLVRLGQRLVLLDCGVRRELEAGQERIYPALTPQIATSLDGVFLSHAHEDHVAALPYLAELGYRGPVYATIQTIQMVKGFMNKWIRFVKAGGGTLPFRKENVDLLDFCPVELGSQNWKGISLTLGRSGHMLGNIWIHFNVGGKTLLYTGDMTFDGQLLAADLPPQADTAILECAYAGRELCQQTQYKTLLQSVKATVAAGGRVLLPVPPNGRGCDILLYLGQTLENVPIWAEKDVLCQADALLKEQQWLHQGKDWGWAKNLPVHSLSSDEQREQALVEGGVILTPDGMLTSKAALFYYERMKSCPADQIIITGHTSKGVMGSLIFKEDYRVKNRVAVQAKRVTIKAHQDEEDALRLAKQLGAKQAMLFHTAQESCGPLLQKLAAAGISGVCRRSPGRLDF